MPELPEVETVVRGMRPVLEGKTLIDMGYTNVSNVGAIGDWEKNGGPINK